MRLVPVFVVTGILCVAPAHAAPILLADQHIAYGIQDLLVDDTLYDVTFRYGSYSEIFTLPPAFLVPYSVGAVNGSGGKAFRGGAAVTNLFMQSQIAAVGDGLGVTAGIFMTPNTIDSNGTIFGVKSDTATQSIQYLWITDGGAPAYATFDQVRMYAVFTGKTETPEPGTLLMLSLGALFAGAMRRRVNQRRHCAP